MQNIYNSQDIEPIPKNINAIWPFMYDNNIKKINDKGKYDPVELYILMKRLRSTCAGREC